MYKKITHYTCLSMLLLHNQTTPKTKYSIIPAQASLIKNVIFDVGDVLVTTSKKSKASLFIPKGFSELPSFFTLLSFNIKSELYKVLHEIEAVTDPRIKIYNQNKAMPQVMADWMILPNSSRHIYHKAVDHVQKSDRPKKLKGILTKIIKFMFDPQDLAQSQSLIQPMADLAKNLKGFGYKIYILSNFANDSFDLLQKRYPAVFEIFDGIMISANEQMVKPETRFFKHLLNKYNLQASQSAFIDDEPHNTQAADSIGIHAITRTSNTAVIQGLKDIGVIFKYH